MMGWKKTMTFVDLIFLLYVFLGYWSDWLLCHFDVEIWMLVTCGFPEVTLIHFLILTYIFGCGCFREMVRKASSIFTGSVAHHFAIINDQWFGLKWRHFMLLILISCERFIFLFIKR